MYRFSHGQSPRGRGIALLLTLLLMCSLFAGCEKDDPEPRPGKLDVTPTAEADPTGDVTPTGEITAPANPTDGPEPTGPDIPTGEPTPTDAPAATETPTPMPTDSPTPTPTQAPALTFGNKMADYYGTWFCKSRAGLESEESQCADNPRDDYRMVFSGDTLVEYHAERHLLTDNWTYSRTFELRTTFSDEEKKMYEEWGYGVSTYLENPTDLTKGHLLYSCTEGSNGDSSDLGALYVIDAQPDGTLTTEFVCVSGNGTFPVFVDSTYTREPVFPMGQYYEDYLGVWHARTIAAYLGDAMEMNDSQVYDIRIVLYEDGRMDIVTVSDDHTTVKNVNHYRYATSFSEDEIKTFKTWDDCGGKTYDSTWKGWAADLAKNPPYPVDGKLLFVSTDEDNPGQLIELEWDDTFKSLDLWEFSFNDKKKEELITFFTFKRESPYSYTPGSCYVDYLGTWIMTEMQLEENGMFGEIEIIDDPTPYVKILINGDMTAWETYNGGPVIYRLRTEKRADDPEWYKNHNLNGAITDLSKRRLVFASETAEFFPGALLVVDGIDTGTIRVLVYGETADSTYYIPLRTLVRQTGLARLQDN